VSNTKRIVTNNIIVEALRNGAGPLTRIQRIAFFLFGSACLAFGVTLVLSSRSVPEEMLTVIPDPRILRILAMPAIGILCLIGVGSFTLGLRLLRHVFWKSGDLL
jgi:hypothetical protein